MVMLLNFFGSRAYTEMMLKLYILESLLNGNLL